jgi:hypothetical protein
MKIMTENLFSVIGGWVFCRGFVATITSEVRFKLNDVMAYSNAGNGRTIVLLTGACQEVYVNIPVEQFDELMGVSLNIDNREEV